MIWCRNCNNLTDESDVVFNGNEFSEEPACSECGICGSDDITDGCRCGVCNEGMEKQSIHICPECIGKLRDKYDDFVASLEEAERNYLEEVLL